MRVGLLDGIPRVRPRRSTARSSRLPALPSAVVPAAANNKDVVVRQIRTPANGTYFLVVNTSMRPAETRMRVPARGPMRDLVARRELGSPFELELKLYSGELRGTASRPRRP